MSRSFPTSRTRRRGQALLLAVLIMIFAALLSASFLVVVSVNLNQTARQTDKNRAAVSSKAGLDYVNSRLTYSPEGDRWFDTQYPQVRLMSLVPTGNNYYSALDMAQGWAGTFAKFPDPRQISQGDGPQFLARVERVPQTLAPGDPEFDKAGALKITIIGLSSDDPTAYNRIVAYKGGFTRSPIANTARFVSNWDFKKNAVPVALADAALTATNNLTVTKANSDFSQLPIPFAVTISDPASGIPARAAVVTAVAPTTPAVAGSYVLTLSTTITANANERVELAANLGAPAGINLSNDVATPPTLTPIKVNLSDTNSDIDATMMPSPNQVDGARVNGGLIYSGNLNAARLRPVSSSFSNTNLIPGLFLASGVIAPDNLSPAPATSVAAINIAGNTGTSDTLQASAPNGVFASSNVAQRNQVVSDGWDRLRGVPSASNTGRIVSDIRPPDIASGEGLERYRNATEYSQPFDDNNPMTTPSSTESLYGGGQGVYIDNTQDKESIYVTEDANGNGMLDPGEDTNGNGTIDAKLREMTQSELVRMWLSPSGAIDKFVRVPGGTTAIALPTAANASLEEEHLRGWVGPDEFRARGVEIVLGNDPTFAVTSPDPLISNPSGAVLTITRDARGDGPVNALGPDPDKVWKNSAGTPQTGVYRRRIAWPQNGVVLADGNVRIKGTAIDAPRSLTVVSLNNLYIEDSLQLQPPSMLPVGYRERKILLMAKKNVVMNPTRVLGRPDAETTTKTPGASQAVPAGPGATLNVVDGLSFQKGDFIQASTIAPVTGVETVLAQGTITADPTAGSITFTATMAGAVPPGALVRTPTAVMNVATSNASTLTPQLRLGFTPVLSPVVGTQRFVAPDQRRLALPVSLPPATLANLRFAFNHAAEQKFAFKADVDVTSGNITDPILFSNKGVFTAPPATMAPYLNGAAYVLAQGDKEIRGQYNQPTPGQDDFPGGVASNPSAPTTPTSETDAIDPTRNLSAISVAMNATIHSDAAPTPNVWKYKTSILNPDYSSLPFFYLAGVGNRLDYPNSANLNPIPAGVERRPNINTTSGGMIYQVPLATSIGIFNNGVKAALYNEVYDSTLATPRYVRTNQFGFSPTYVDAGTPPEPEEDILTSDQSFYQTDPVLSTLDSRQLGAGLVLGNNSLLMRQSDGVLQPTGTEVIPEYRIEGLKLENVGLKAAASDVDTIAPAYTFTVNAYVYAQTGSWFVIPGGTFDERLKTKIVAGVTTTFLDLNGNNAPDAGEFILDGTNGVPDLNRNGTVEPAERNALARYSRYNYQINFFGAIGENRTALVNDAGTIKGAVSDWMNKWATTSLTGGATGTPVTTNSRIHFVFDPTIAADQLQPDDPTTPTVDESDTGFRLPQTTDLFYQD